MDILAFWIVLFVYTAESVCAENTCPEVTQQLLKEGFHRDLLIRVNLATTNESTRNCMVAVKVHLPKGLYVDPYEMTSLQMHNLTESNITSTLPISPARREWWKNLCSAEEPRNTNPFPEILRIDGMFERY